MKNSQSIIIGITALILGLGLGYFLFTPKESEEMHSHSHESTTAIAGEETIWTCSMHPQIRQSEPGDCAICGMDLIPLEENTSSDPLVLEMTKEAVKLANIQTSIVGNSALNTGRQIRLSGKIQADERLAASQVAHLSGRIEKLWVQFTGETVQKGQKIAAIYAPEFISAQQELLEAKKWEEQNPALLEAARKKLTFWKVSPALIAEIETSWKIKETLPIFADHSGIVEERKVAVGDYITKGEVLFDLINLNKVWVILDAYEEDLAYLAKGDRIRFNSQAIPGQDFTSRISFIDPVINRETRTTAIRAEVNNSNGLLKPEMLVYAIVEQGTLPGQPLTVPKSAVLWTGTRSVVYVKVPDQVIPSFQYRNVELGESMGTSYIVLEGLEAGEEIVTQGSFTIDAAAQLNNQASMMNQQVALKGIEKPIEEIPDFKETTPAAFQKSLETLTVSYLIVKDHLVETDARSTKIATEDILQDLAQIDPSGLPSAAKTFWEKQHHIMETSGKQMSQSKEIEAQRIQFDLFSKAIIKTVKAFGVLESELYIQHCPMAFDDTGADWISKEEAVLNPYFGDVMLRCGWVKETLETVEK